MAAASFKAKLLLVERSYMKRVSLTALALRTEVSVT